MPPRPLWASTPPSGYGGTDTGSLASGAMGTLGTNVLQQGLDTLNISVQNLTTAVNSLVQNIQTSGGSGLGGGSATRQQGPGNNNGGFPRMVNPSRQGTQTAGGNGGFGNNMSGMSSGGYRSNRTLYTGNGGFGGAALAIGGAVAGFGVAQSQNLVALNSYATQSLTGYNYNGMSQNQAMNQLYGQVGALPGQQLSIGTGNIRDNLQFAQTLQAAAGSQNISQTARGRGALNAAYGFGISNPNLTAASAASMGAGLYSPMLSYNMARLGYGQTILSRSPGGVNLNGGQSAQAILSGLGLKGASSQQVTAAFASGGKAAVSLPYLLQGTNISQQAMQQYLTDYAQLMNNSKLSSSQASNLMQQAASGSAAQMKSARAQLSKYGISTANNDLSALVQNQASQTGRAGDYASGFNSGLQQSAGLLEDFNNALNALLKGPLGSALGYGGGALGTVAGSALGSGANMLGTAGSYMMMQRLFRRGGAAQTAITEGETAAESGMLMRLLGGRAGAALGLGAAGLVLSGVGQGDPTKGQVAGQPTLFGMQPTSNKSSGWYSWSGFGRNLGNWAKDLGNLMNHNPATMGGGAAATSMGTAQKSGTSSQSGSVSGAARKAVGAAESQIGVPYAYGQETAGVGFDCSALIQWAYKQAGVNLPRTSQSQWSALAKRTIPLNRVQEGDLVFAAGSDGTSNSPGHVGMMVNGHQVIQAAHRGTDIAISAYSPSDWQHAARPSGSGSFIAGNVAASSAGASSTGTGKGNTGAKSAMGGAYGSVNEKDVISAMGSYLGGGMGGSRMGTGSTNGTSGSNNTITGSVAGAGSTITPTSASSVVSAVRAAAKKFGWSTGNQWSDLVKVINRESSWNLTAQNPTSTAYGLAQFINGPSEYYSYGGNPNTAAGQAIAMMNYIKQRYGSPAGAWQSEQKIGSYGAGGTTIPGLALVGERGPELMMQGGGNKVFSNAQTMQLINAIRGSSPGQGPWKTNATENTTSKSIHQSSPSMNVTFGTNSIIINSSGNNTQTAAQSGREIQRHIVKHLGNASIHQAIKQGDKL